MRPIIKTIIYRIGAIVSNIILAFVLGLPLEVSTALGILIEVIHSIWYYMFEKICEKK